MKISIVTVYDSYNCGSFLQAYAMYKTLQKKGNDVNFLRRESFKEISFSVRLTTALKRFLRGRFKRAKSLMEEYFIFKRMQKKLPQTDTVDGQDLVVYGSDTIWNMDDEHFREEWKRYWGMGVKAKKITYGASVGSSKEEVFYANPDFKKCINEFDAVLVRDNKTYKVAETLLDNGKKPEMVIDPTMLLEIGEYDDITGTCDEKDFILLYVFEELPQKQKESIAAFAKENNKKIISFGKDIPFVPEKMLAYYKAADYVITNTFHGNVFSILYNKKFVSFGKGKDKIVSLLDEFGLSDRLIDVNDSFLEVVDKDIDYVRVNKALEEKREGSLKKLGRVID